MKVISNDQFKSLSPFEWVDIAPLSIITGLNGVGKTQMIELIQQKYYEARSERTRHIGFEDFDFGNGQIIIGNSSSFIFSEGLFSYDILEFLITSIYDNKASYDKNGARDYQIYNEIIENLHRQYPRIDRGVASRFTSVAQHRNKDIWNYVSDKSGKDIASISMEDIALYFPISIFMEDRSIMTNDGTDFLFYMHQYMKVARQRAGIVEIEPSQAPWDILNEVIKASNLPYKVSYPAQEDIESIFRNPLNKISAKSFKINLVHAETNEDIGFANLSSGEKVLMSLALMLYSSQERGMREKLILFDEPDAHLHPSMIKQFFSVIYDVIVKKYKTTVIMTTHSASTVALSPDSNDCVIYELKKSPTTIVRVLSKEKAISNLSEGLLLITSSIKYVLVEGENDKPFYEALYRIFYSNKDFNKHLPLAFVPGQGVVSVHHWSHGLRNAGLSEIVRGIIDRDNGNEPSQGVFRLERYSIENYLFDPLLVFAECTIVPTGITRFGFQKGEEYKILLFSVDQIQQISDEILTHVEIFLSPTLTIEEKECVEVEYTNGMLIRYPKWFINRSGKVYQQVFRKEFGTTLDRRAMILAMKRVGIIPKDLLDLFKLIQS